VPPLSRVGADGSRVVVIMAGLVALGVLVVTAFGFAGQARTLPMTFARRVETFAYGPVVGAARQTFVAPASYLSEISLAVRAQGEPTPVQLRLRAVDGVLLAEGRTIVTPAPEPVTVALAVPPIEGSAGMAYVLEIERGVGGDGRLLLPIDAADATASERFVDHDGVERPGWTAHLTAMQTVRPATFFRTLLGSDPLTALGVFAAYALGAMALGALLRWSVRRLILPGLAPAAYLLGAAGAVAVAWLTFAGLPIP